MCVQAADDPIAPKNAIPVTAIRANPLCLLAITPAGGHLGWCSGPGAPFGEPATTQRTECCVLLPCLLTRVRGWGDRRALGGRGCPGVA